MEAIALALFKSWLSESNHARVVVGDLICEGVIEIGDGYRAKNSELGRPGLPFIRAGDLNNGFDTTGADTLSQESVARGRNKISRAGDIAFYIEGHDRSICSRDGIHEFVCLLATGLLLALP